MRVDRELYVSFFRYSTRIDHPMRIDRELYVSFFRYGIRIDHPPSDQMRRWLIRNCGHGDIGKRHGSDVWILERTEKPLKKQPMYFFWGLDDSNIQFRKKEDMVKFIIKFA